MGETNIPIRIFPSPVEYATQDARDEDRVKEAIRTHVLAPSARDYLQVHVKTRRNPDQSPKYLVAYLLRKDVYKADVVRVDVDANFAATKVTNDYQEPESEEEKEPSPRVSDAYDSGYDFVASTPVPDIPTAKAAVETIGQMATAAGLRVKVLEGPEATVANYQKYLRAGLAGFVNIGHGNTGLIVLYDGTLDANWFKGLTQQPLSPEVIYFNSCETFNPPLEPAIMAAGARTFVGGIVDLAIGASEEVCKGFWSLVLTTTIRMDDALHQSEKQHYPTTGAHGIAGDGGPFRALVGRNRTPISVVARYPEHLDVFDVASDGRTMSVWWDAGTGWRAWFPLKGGLASGGGTGSPITAVARYSGHLDLFTVGTDGRVYSAFWDVAGGWSDWFAIGTLICRPGSTVNAVARYNDHLDLFTTAADGRVMSTWWDARTGWANWFQVQGGVAAAGTTVTAIARYPFHLDLFTVGKDNRVYSCWWDDRSGWSNWFTIGTLVCRQDSTVSAISRFPDQIDLFTTGSDSKVMSTFWNVRSGWAAWFQVAGGVASPGSPVTAIARHSNHIDIFVIGTDNKVYSTWWHEGLNWAGWFNVSAGVGQPGGQVAAITRITDHIDLFTVGANGRVVSSYWDIQTGWAPWFAIGLAAPFNAAYTEAMHVEELAEATV
ncbi:MAG TPA: hypothetical protein VMH81_24290 [Bryobacteraceae bacterium]|nr:hypothetical protein [Bryobacteraceae bacterium]